MYGIFFRKTLKSFVKSYGNYFRKHVHMYGIFFRKTLKPFVKSYGNYFRKHVHMYGICFVRLTLLHLKFFQFKMAALNKRAVLVAMLVISRRRRRRRIKKNKANFKKRLWIRPKNADRLNSGAFYSAMEFWVCFIV